MDSALLPFLRSTDQAEREQLLSDLILLTAAPVIRRVLRQRLGFYVNQFGVNPHNLDAEDLYHVIVTKLLAALNDSRLRNEQIAIKSFRHYVSGLAVNACHDYLRAKSPARNRLKNNLRDIFERHRDFALWRADGNRTLCGFALWR